MRLTSSLRLGLAALFALTIGGGCAEERPPINRVQANALAKSFFVGADLASPSDDPEFYSRATIIDVGYGDSNGFYTSGNAQTVARIKWEVTEKHLLGRLTYELITDADGHGAKASNTGVVIASFPITSHFDIRRAYNAQTGEESNVIEENTSDRPWFEREYFRVDWSGNEVTDAYDFDWLSFSGILNGVDYQSLAYYTSDDSEDAPVFDAEAGYFDVTNRVWASPKVIDTPYGTYPACFFRGEVSGGTYPVGSCNPTEIKIRLSFRKVGDNDYEPKDWTGTRFSMYGAFYEERRGYEDQYGVVDASWHRFGSFYNIWQKTHLDLPCNTFDTTPAGLLPNRDGDEALGEPENGTDDECEDQGAPAGSYCDQFSRKCAMPLAQREVRAIPWHVGPGEDPELFKWTQKATAEWDIAVRSGVQAGRLTECKRTNGASIKAPDANGCKAAFPMDDASVAQAVPEIIFLCHNPVAEGDRPECGAVGQVARRGDLRYNFVNAIDVPQNGSPWGVMLDGVDPLTGEKVQSSINLWDSVTRIAAQSAVDVMRWINGELDEESIKSGAYINEYAITGDLQPKSFEQFQTMSKKEINGRLSAIARTPEGVIKDPASAKAMSQLDLVQSGAAAFDKQFGDPIDNGPLVAARVGAAKESMLEAELTTSSFLELSGLDPLSDSSDQQVLDYASPLRGASVTVANEIAELREKTLAERGACELQAPEPTSFIGMAKIMKSKFPIPVDEAGNSLETSQQTFERISKMRNYMRYRMHYGVILHEMGHSIGLRHNFVGSFDSLNFRPQYWQLRTHNGEVKTPCDDQTSDGSTCVGPRWFDPMTEEEDDGLLWMWQHTTVMDYAGDISQDTLGLGRYDRAAARFFYGDALSTWDAEGQECNAGDDGACTQREAFALQSMVGNSGGIGGQWVFFGDYQFSSARHYSQFGTELGLLRNCRAAEATPPADWNEAVDGRFDQVFDGQVVLGTVCDSPPEDFVGYRQLQTYQLAKDGKVRWPHMFATDYSADIGNVAVLRHDNGSDAYEQFNYLINMYENRHIFDNFRRGRQAWSIRGALSRSMSRTSDKMRNIVQAFGLYHDYFLRGLTMETGVDYVTPYESTDGVLKPLALASTLAFDHFTRQLTRPHPGDHTVLKDLDGVRVMLNADAKISGTTVSMTLPEGSQIYERGPGFGARQVNNSLSNADGSFDVQWLTGAGSYYDKVYSIYHMTESSNRFLDVSYLDFVDGRYRNLSLVNVFPDGFRRLLAASLTGDIATIGPRVTSVSGNTPEVEAKTKWPRQGIGWVSFWPEEGPEACWPAQGMMVCTDFTGKNDFDNNAPDKSLAVDPALGIEVQKFLIFYALLYLPENWKMNWVDQLRIYSVGGDNTPDLPSENAIHWKDPESGTLYIARRYGTEDIFGKTVEKGVAARMLAWANKLTEAAYEVQAIDPVTGKVVVVTQNGLPLLKNGVTTCEDSPACIAVRNYKPLIDFARRTASDFGFPAPEPKGIDFN